MPLPTPRALTCAPGVTHCKTISWRDLHSHRDAGRNAIGPTLVILAAGLSTRYGGAKQLEPVGPSGEALLDYGVCDALRAGFSDVVLVIRRDQEASFREHVERVLGGGVSLRYAFQNLEYLPAGRTKPWGTGHAVMAAAGQVDRPFAVMNADDFYGAGSLAALGDYLRGLDATDRGFALVGFRVGDTLSDAGGVSRGVCVCDAEGRLESVTEVRHIRRGATGITGVTAAGEAHPLTGDEIASMNLWGCTPAAFPLVEQHFARFQETWGMDPEAEFLLAGVVSSELAQGTITVQVLESRDAWFGMTFPADRERVAAELAGLVSRGRYPADLSAWFHTHRGTH